MAKAYEVLVSYVNDEGDEWCATQTVEADSEDQLDEKMFAYMNESDAVEYSVLN